MLKLFTNKLWLLLFMQNKKIDVVIEVYLLGRLTLLFMSLSATLTTSLPMSAPNSAESTLKISLATCLTLSLAFLYLSLGAVGLSF